MQLGLTGGGDFDKYRGRVQSTILFARPRGPLFIKS